MKKRISIFVMLLVLSGMLFFQSCLDKTPVPFEEYGAFTIPALVAPANGAFISPAGTTVELTWSSTDLESDPQKWDVYFGPAEEPARVATGYTSQTYTANVAIGTKYYWRVVGWDSKGIPTRSEVWSFEVVDPDAAANLKMTWTTNALEAIGQDLAPTDVLNLRLLILEDDLVTLAVPAINTAGFEEFTGFNSLPDGTYYIATDFSQTVNAGDFNAPIDVSINLGFNQRGIYSQSIPYANVMTNTFNCFEYKTVLAKVEKTGLVYNVSPAVSYISPDPNTLKGSWSGDVSGYPSEIVTTIVDGKLLIDGVGLAWMLNDWGEPAIETFPAEVIVNYCEGTVTIPQQEFMNTTWLGDPQPTYSITGTGTLDLTGASPVIHLEYDFIQVAGAGAIARYFGIPFFWADITLDGAKGTVISPSGTSLNLIMPKPAKK